MSDRPIQQGLAARMSRVVPGGVDSNVRLEVADRFFVRGQGARLWDADGGDYVDYVLGQGPAFLGHGHPQVVERVQREIASLMTPAAQTPIELEAAEKIVDVLGWPEMVRIGMTSTESVQAALRLARTHTGRRLFVRFRGHYHGWLDNVLADPSSASPRPAGHGQLPEALEQSLVLEWNDLAAFRALLDQHGDDVAAVLTEPMMLNAGAILPEPGFLQGLRQECTRRGIVLVMDETITGFRLSPTGAVGRFGVVPDLAVYGKAVAGGFPASVLAGPSSLMSYFAAGTNHSGTFNANVLSCAAICAALDVIGDGSVHARVDQVGSDLMAALGRLAAERELPLRVRGVPAAFHLSFDSDEPVRRYDDLVRADTARYRRVVRQAHAHGVWLAGRGIWYVSAAHDSRTTADTLERFARALDTAESEDGAR